MYSFSYHLTLVFIYDESMTIGAVWLFGGLWGFWGVFFAIPLATLFKAVMYAWPREAAAVVVETGE